MDSNHFSILSAGTWIEGEFFLEVKDSYQGDVVFTTSQAGFQQVHDCLKKHESAESITKLLSTSEKKEILYGISFKLKELKEDFAKTIALEAGKPIFWAKQEVDRAIQTFRIAAEIIGNLHGEFISLDIRKGLENTYGLVKRFPIGNIIAISPFNFPLNLVAHKLAPAIAAGCPIILKPASKTPITALKLAKIILESGFPAEALSVLPCNRDNGQELVESHIPKLLSFTGSPDVGWGLKAVAGKKKVILELGGDAAALICKDTDLEKAAQKCAIAAFAYAGQICISIQRIVIEESVYQDFIDLFLQQVASLKVGNPLDETTICGPLIDNTNQRRVLEWILEAERLGAKKIFGGEAKENNIVTPCVLSNVPKVCKLGKDEAFAPIVNLIKVKNFQEGIEEINASRFGLQAGIFTQNQAIIKQCFEQLQVGGVIVNDAPTLRVDSMPYGGIKDSGLGREGVAYAYKDMTEEKILVW